MILSGKEIEKKISDGAIKIEPFHKSKLNPNSYNLTLHKELAVYEDYQLDIAKKMNIKPQVIPDDGFLLTPNRLYLGRTNERTYAKDTVPMLEGRSSLGRLGIFVHITAGFGDVGFNGFWTLEISCVQPVVIYPNIDIAQIYFHTIQGDFELYNGKYNNNIGIQASKLYKEF